MNALETDSVATESLGETLRKILKPVASLQLTVGLFAASLVLVFFGTLAQKNAGIWQIVARLPVIHTLTAIVAPAEPARIAER